MSNNANTPDAATADIVRADLALSFPTELPITARLDDVAAALGEHQLVIVAGETGSGKTTQLAKLCLQLGRGAEGKLIGHTQPRRLAARSVAQRIAEELGQRCGDTVGYQVRFSDTLSEHTRVKLMTDGILLAEIEADRSLARYDTLIIDEAHERSLNIDFLLGYLKQLLPRRPDLKVIITSATIDVENFSQHFDDAPVIEVSGRSFPVDTHYLEPDGVDAAAVEQAAAAIERIVDGEFGTPGDTLVFLSGEREIRELALLLRRADLRNVEVLPLYARLSQAEQQRVFDTRGRRGMRVVLATNVAETSLTVPGIRFVVDTGYARISRYSVRSKLQRLPIEPISQASANQRQGRCGRVAAGVCLRLYSEQDFAGRPEYTEPEIQRTNLAAVILRMLQLGLGDVGDFPFINPPDQRLVRDGYRLLQELRAVDKQGALTALGQTMARLPVDPRFSRMLLKAADSGCLRELLIIASALSVQDPRERPADKQLAADQAHRRFWDERSDFLAFVNLWNYYEQQRQRLSQNQLHKLCKREYLSFLRMREWRDVHRQLTIACRDARLRQNTEAADYASLHRALMSGLLDNLAQWQEGREYLGSRNRKLQLFPGSSQARKRPRWALAAEIVETSQVFARCVAKIEPDWALDINPDLLKHHDYEPYWHMRSGRVMARRRTSLFGLVLADAQRIHYGPVNPTVARELLIRGALVEGRIKPAPEFLRHNLALVEDLQTLESKARRRDLVADEELLFEFYDERLPSQVTTANRLRSWLKKDASANASLRMPRAKLLLRPVDEELGQQFPDYLHWQDMQLALSYHFEPGHPEDGVSVTVPLGLLNRIPNHLFEWLVPGLLREKCIALVKALPKRLRKQLVPVPDYVDRALLDVTPQDRPLTDVLAGQLQELSGLRIDRTDWPLAALDDYYRMNVRIVDADGKLIQQGRDLAALVETCRDQSRASLVADTTEDMPAQLTRWSIDSLPLKHRSRQAGVDVESYPALEDRGDSVAVVHCDYPQQAANSHRAGVVRLLRLQAAQQVRTLRRSLLKDNAASLLLAGAGLEREPLLDDLTNAVFWRCCLEPLESLPRDSQSFTQALSEGRRDLVNMGNDYERVLLNMLKPLVDARKRVTDFGSSAQGPHRDVKADVGTQLDQLLAPGFLFATPWQWFSQYPRYMKALAIRLERVAAQPGKDAAHTETLNALQEPLTDMLKSHPSALLNNPELRQYRWMIEELRVSFFAQSLGTSLPVSAKRLAEQWDRAEQWMRENPR
ncbi:MAG: ATP-dependent RNA helicase HrpA [Pseudomonadota bacterium]